MVPLADGRRRVRRRRLPRHRSAPRLARRRGSAPPRGARERHPRPDRPRPEPHVVVAPVVPRCGCGGPLVSGAGPLHLPRRARARRRRAAEQLAERLRQLGLDARRRTERPAGAVVPPPVRAGAAGPRLGEPRGPGRVRVDPPLLVRPRVRRRPDRCRGRVRQGPGAPGHAAGAVRGRQLPRRAPALGPTGGPRDSPAVAPTHGRLRAATRSHGRDRCRGPGTPLALPAPDPAPRSVQLPVHGDSLGRVRAAYCDRRDTRGPRTGRRDAHVGALEP